jgi:hypothetical protein
MAMRKLRHWQPGIAALIACLAVVGCGHGGAALAGGNGNQSTAAGGTSGADGPGAPGAPGQNEPNGAKGAPGGNGSNGGNGGKGGARGAPIKIPDIVQTYGLSISVVMNLLINGEPDKGVKGLAAECGGQLCVTLKTRPGGTADDDDNRITQCQFVGRTDPKIGDVVYSRDTIWVLTGNLPCAPPSADGGSPGGDQAPDGGSPPADAGSPQADAGPSPADSTSP